MLDEGRGRGLGLARQAARSGLAAPRALGEKQFDQPILQRMKCHDGEPTARPKRALGGVKRGDEFAKLVVDGDAQSLKRPGGRMYLAGFSRRDALDHRRQLTRRQERRLLAVMDNGAGDAARGALLAIIIEDVGQRFLFRLVDDLRRATAPPFHPHVERPVAAKGKAALGLVELHRGNANVEHDAIERQEIFPRGDLLQLGKARLDQGQPAGGLFDEPGSAKHRQRVAIESQHARARKFEQGARIAARPEGGVEIASALLRIERRDGLGEQHGRVAGVNGLGFAAPARHVLAPKGPARRTRANPRAAFQHRGAERTRWRRDGLQ